MYVYVIVMRFEIYNYYNMRLYISYNIYVGIRYTIIRLGLVSVMYLNLIVLIIIVKRLSIFGNVESRGLAGLVQVTIINRIIFVTYVYRTSIH